MREFTVKKNDENQRLDKFLKKLMPEIHSVTNFSQGIFIRKVLILNMVILTKFFLYQSVVRNN